MINKLKSEKGITGIDLTISLIIITLFVSIIVTLSMNVSASLASKKRIKIATNCMTEIMEKVDSMNYESIEEIATFTTISAKSVDNPNNLKQNVQNILNSEGKKYNILQVELKTEKYMPENDTPRDVIKKVTVKITYNKDEVLEVTRLKTRYNVNLEENETTN